MIKDAEKRGVLVRGEPGIVVEGTAGNTGIGLALSAASFGYNTIICMAETQSEEKKQTLRLAGAHLGVFYTICLLAQEFIQLTLHSYISFGACCSIQGQE